jgi:hypothetical protein
MCGTQYSGLLTNNFRAGFSYAKEASFKSGSQTSDSHVAQELA